MTSVSTPLRRVQRVRHELRRRELDVVAVTPLSPGFVSITFAGESLDDFRSDSFDDHVKLLFPNEAGELAGRDYTPRRFSRTDRRLTIDFATHGDGVAERWVRQARVGQRLTIGGPRGSMIIPTDYAWHLLVGDAAAMPAIARRLEELPAGTPTRVIVQAPEADRPAWTRHAQLDLQWVDDADALVSAVQQRALPAGEGFVWAAGEAAVMARLRQVLLDVHHHPREAMRVAAYWKRGTAAHHENLEA